MCTGSCCRRVWLLVLCEKVYIGLGEMQPRSVPKILLESVLQGKTILANLTSAQDRRTLTTASLNSLRIRVEAHANSVEQSIKQRQLSLVQNLKHCGARTSNTQEGLQSDSDMHRRFRTSNHLEHSAHQSSPVSEPGK